MIFFDIGSSECVDVFLEKLNLFMIVESLGVVESLIFVLFRMIYVLILCDCWFVFGIMDGFVWILVGIEDIEDLMVDVKQVFDLFL